jgi:hypothetical protein
MPSTYQTLLSFNHKHCSHTDCQSIYISTVLYAASLLAVKTTLLTQYYRLFSVQSVRFTYIAVMVLVIGWSVAQVFVAVFACVPVAAFWDDRVAAGAATCIPRLTQRYVNAAGNIATEVMVIALPLPAIGGLNLPRAQRLMLMGIFSLGFTYVHLHSLKQIKTDHTPT